ncbi:MAG: hypothetical protein IPG23_18950 [Burkholderiales bacterium]|nr:hypothetical protein [Burkholderiales bacterium]
MESLKQRGGKRLMLRLSPEALQALRTIMSVAGYEQETDAINRVLIAHIQSLGQNP